MYKFSIKRLLVCNPRNIMNLVGVSRYLLISLILFEKWKCFAIKIYCIILFKISKIIMTKIKENRLFSSLLNPRNAFSGEYKKWSWTTFLLQRGNSFLQPLQGDCILLLTLTLTLTLLGFILSSCVSFNTRAEYCYIITLHYCCCCYWWSLCWEW